MRWKLILSFCVVSSFSVFYCKKNTTHKPEPEVVIPPVTLLKLGFMLQADGPGNTYELINTKLGGTAEEAPDCAHTIFGRHIAEVYDDVLKKNVFEFSIHVTPDNDRCNGLTDRQRNEIKTYGPSPDGLKGALGETVTYRWKFKLDAGFKPSPSFTHIHQIKAGDGDDDSPLITITPRHGNPEQLEIIHTAGSSSTTLGKVKTVNLAPFKGNWVEVVEKIKYGTNGTIDITLKNVSNGALLSSYTNANIDLWRTGTTFVRPKWGIYRSLNNTSYLRDEYVRFADFCIAEGDAVCQ